ncbi:MAG: hypothetical protein JWP57_266 [Spirosoma sp.]|nr:hypothetical protein [Spirosoma sp.]
MSIRDEQIFSLVAVSGLKEQQEHLSNNLIVATGELDVLRSAVVYGANASGKSNLLRAIEFFIDSITLAPPTGSAVSSYSPFVLDQKSPGEPTLLEAIFVMNNVVYRYGFEVQQQAVIAEWLFIRRKQETYVFDRSSVELRINRPYKKLIELQNNKMVAQTALLLNLGALFNDETCQTVQNWASDVRCIQGTEDYQFRDYTIQYLEKPENKQRILNLLRDADLGIEDIELIRPEKKTLTEVVVKPTKFYGGDWIPSNPTALTEYLQGSYRMKTSIQNIGLKSTRVFWDARTSQFKSISMPFNSFESQGTQKFFNLIGLILWHLDNGGVLIADELDTKLHPLLTQRIVQLFNSSLTNPRNAQFVFATHDTNLLSAGLFRRDQIWFTEKDSLGATQLYALTDYKPGGKTVRNDEQLEKNYIAGKYGGIPYLGNFDALFERDPMAEEIPAHE